jgi:hypothetical protein
MQFVRIREGILEDGKKNVLLSQQRQLAQFGELPVS